MSMEDGGLLHEEAGERTENVEGKRLRGEGSENTLRTLVLGVSKTATREQELQLANAAEASVIEELEGDGSFRGFFVEGEVHLDIAESDISEQQQLCRQLFLKEEEIAKLTEREANLSAQLKEQETIQQQQAAEFTDKIECLKLQHSEEVSNALSACVQAQQELQTLKVQSAEEMERVLAESESNHAAKVQELRAEFEKICVNVEDKKEQGESGKWESLLPQPRSQLSPEVQKELRLQRERLRRQHKCELKVQEQKLRTEQALENETMQAKLEEDYTSKLAKVLTESAIKNASQVEQISQQLRLEKHRIVSQLQEEHEERYGKEAARLAEERQEAVEACRIELESVRAGYNCKITELEAALARERGKHLSDQPQEEWVEREERLRTEMMVECRQRVEEVQTQCDREKEAALMSMQAALEQRLETELRSAHQMHQQALTESQEQLQAAFEMKLAAVQEDAHTLQNEDTETIRAQLEKEITKKLQAVHQVELAAMQRESETEKSRQQEDIARVREEMEARVNEELEQLTQSHKAEVELLQQQYQTQLDEMALSNQHALSRVRETVEEDMRHTLEQQHHSHLQQLQNAHNAQLTMVEEEGAERLAEISRELQQIKEHNKALQIQLDNAERELSEVAAVAEQQRSVLVQHEEETNRLRQEVREMEARERETEEQGHREHQEDTASLAILHKQLSTLTNEKVALQSSLAMLQSSVAGCIQLAGLVEQALSPPTTAPLPSQWHTPSALHNISGAESNSRREESGGDAEGDDTLTPPADNISPNSAIAGGVTSGSSVVWTKSATNLQSDSALYKHTPSDDSGLASQQASVVNSEATMVVTPLVDGSEASTATPDQSSHPPNLTILPLDDTAVSHNMSQAAPATGLSYDQSQVGMLSISFLDATQHQSHLQPSIPRPAAPSTHTGELSVTCLGESLLPLNLSHLPALQEGLAHLHETVSLLLRRYVTMTAEAVDCQQKLVNSTTQLREALSSQEAWAARVSELESEAKLRDEELAHTTQSMANAQDNLQAVVREVEEAKTEVESIRQQLVVTQEALTASQQREGETAALLREKTEECDAHKHAMESQGNESQQHVLILTTQNAQLQEELRAAQRNCASAVYEREAMHEENKRLASVQVTLEGQLHSLEEETRARQRESERELKQREDEIRELQVVRAELSSHQEAQEVLRMERDELQQRLGNVEHQLALCQVVPVEEQMSRIQELTAREAQLTADLRQQAATSQALQERVRVAQESLNQTTQENLSVKIGQAQLEGEVQRLRDELQRRETALHRAQAQSASQSRELDIALQELEQLRAREEEDREVQGDGEEEEGSGNEGEEDDPPLEEVSHERNLSLQRELQQQREVENSLQTQIGLLKDTLNSKDRELEALRMARQHQEQALQQMSAQLRTREDKRNEEDQQVQVEMGKRNEEEEGEEELHSTVQSERSSTSAIIGDDGSTRSILVRLAELAPILSKEAHTVNQLTKNILLPDLSVEQLKAAIDSLRQTVGALSVQRDDSGERLIGVLEAVQNLVQELTIVLSSLDQGNTTQLPQQLSAVSELLSRLLSADRQSLVQDTNILRETIDTLQSQLQHQIQQVKEENAQLRSNLEEARVLLQQKREEQRLDSEVSPSAQLKDKQLATQNAISQLEAEVAGLQSLLTSMTSELEEAQSRLTEYKNAEDSLERSAHTISSLHQELRASKQKEAELETALQELSFSKSELGHQHSREQVQHTATLSSVQEALNLERATKDEVNAQLSAVQAQLQQVQEAHLSSEAERRQFSRRMERELKQAQEVGERAQQVCGEGEAELRRVQALLQSLQADNREQEEHYSHLLDSERRMVVSLRSSLQAKERELTDVMDRYLQEKVGAAKTQGELAAVSARLDTARQHINSLQTKLSSLHAETESKAGDESLRQLEQEQLRRELHQLQTTSEQLRNRVTELMQERQQLQATVSSLQTQVTSLQRQSSRDREKACESNNIMQQQEKEIVQLQQQLVNLRTPAMVLPEDHLQVKLMKLYTRYREAEVHRKALVFQKNYLKCQVDAFFQTQQAALVIMADMGAPSANTPKTKSRKFNVLKFKTVVHTVMAALRFQYVVRRKHQYIQSYSNRIAREKAGVHVTLGTCSRQLETAIPFHLQPQCPSTTSATIVASSTMSPCHSKHMTSPPYSSSGSTHLKSPSTQLHQHGQNEGPLTIMIEPQLSTYIPSLARLQAKLSGTAN